MEFKSIEEIKEHFGFSFENVEDLRKELKKLLLKSHPDTTGNNFQATNK